MPSPGGRGREPHSKSSSGTRVAWRALAVIASAGIAALPATAIAAGEVVEAPDGGGPMYYLRAFGSPGHEITRLAWGVTWLSVAVLVIVTVLVVAGVALRARRIEDMRADAHSVARAREERAMPWIYAAIAATVGTLAFFVTWTVGTMVEIQAPDEAPAATIEVTAHQWWWEIAYQDDGGSTLFETANEIHVPVGRPVKFILRSADVIHSFWVPLLGGKTDLIPGQENVAWLRADTEGVYRGQCVEYCGRQHAHMSFRLWAVPQDEFDAWLARQRQPANEGQVRPGAPGEPIRGDTCRHRRASEGLNVSDLPRQYTQDPEIGSVTRRAARAAEEDLGPRSRPLWLAGHSRPQDDRQALHHDLVPVPVPWRQRGAGHAPAARPARRDPADARAVQRAVLDARADDDLPLRAAGAVGLLDLPVPAAGRCAGHGVPAPERLLVLGFPVLRPVDLRQLSGRGRAERWLVQLRRPTRSSPTIRA